MTLAPLATFASASALGGAVAVVYASLMVVPRAEAGQIAIPMVIGAPLLLAGAALLAGLVLARPRAAEGGMGLAPGALEPLRRTVAAALAALAIAAALLLASDIWAYTTLGWAIPQGAPVFVG